MKKLIAFLMLMACTGFAAEQVTLLITVTNHAETGDTIALQGTTRTWTNSYSSVTIQTNAATGPAPTATNLAYSLSLYSPAAGAWTVQTNTNTIRVVFPVGTAVTASESGSWATFTYVTQVVTRAWVLRVPLSVESATNQTNFASMLVDGLAKATNRFQAAWEAFTNFPALAGPNRFTGTNWFEDGWWTNASIINAATMSGTFGNLTNGLLTNTILLKPTMTNGASYGGFRSPGSGAASEQFGSNATASGTYAVAVGSGSEATAYATIAIGYGTVAGGVADIAIGSGAEAQYGSGVVLGTGAAVNATNAIAIGAHSLVAANHASSAAFGPYVSTTETNQLMLGTNTHKVRIPGRLEAYGTITNATHTGTNSIGVSGGPCGFLALRRLNVTSLANGNNAGIDPGGSSYIKVSGPTAAFTVCGITNGTDGYFLIVENNSGFNMTIANDSGVDPSPANRIYTMAGADVTLDGSSIITLVYDSAVSRWILKQVNAADFASSYAELYTSDNAGAQTLDTSGAYEVLTNFNTAGNSSTLTVSAATNSILTDAAGIFNINFHISFSGTASKTFTVAVFTNGVVAANIKCERMLGVGGDIGSASACGIVSLPASSFLDVRCKPNDDAVAITVKQANFSVHKIE